MPEAQVPGAAALATGPDFLQRDRQPSQALLVVSSRGEFPMVRLPDLFEKLVAYDKALARGAGRLAERAVLQLTHRNRAEERPGRLRLSDQHLRLGMRASRTAFFEVDLERGELSQDPRFHGWPELPLQVRGSPDEICAALFLREDLPRVRETLRALLEGSATTASIECRRKTSLGRAGWVRCSIVVVDRDARGRARRLCGMATDITEWKALQERTMRAERLASAAMLVRGMSHEINNPLASVIGNLSYAQQQVGAAPSREGAASADDQDRQDLSQALGDASEAAQRIRTLVARLRTFTSEHSREPRSELRRVVDDALELAAYELTRCAEVSVELPALPDVAAAPVELAEVLVNLLVNAGQATGREPNRVRLAAELRSPTQLVVQISDTGVGIDPAIAPRVFDPFFTTRSAGRGAGLGLTICLDVVRSVGGDISIESAPGKGTTVTVVLPVAPEKD